MPREILKNTTFVIIADRAMLRRVKDGPIPFYKYKDKNILEYQIANIRTVDKTADIMLVCGFQVFDIVERNYDIRIIENTTYLYNGEAESLRLGMNAVTNKTCFLLNADTILGPKDILQMSKNNTVLVKKDKISRFGLSTVAQGNKFISFSFNHTEGLKWMNATSFVGDDVHKMKIFLHSTNKNLKAYECINRSEIEFKVLVSKDSVVVEEFVC